MNVLKAASRAGFFVVIASLAGCGSKLHYEKTLEMSSSQPMQTLTIEAPKQDQKVKVDISSKEPVEVVVVLSKDDDGKGKPLATKKDVKTDSLEVTIPKGQEFRVIISASKDTKVTVKIDNVN